MIPGASNTVTRIFGGDLCVCVWLYIYIYIYTHIYIPCIYIYTDKQNYIHVTLCDSFLDIDMWVRVHQAAPWRTARWTAVQSAHRRTRRAGCPGCRRAPEVESHGPSTWMAASKGNLWERRWCFYGEWCRRTSRTMAGSMEFGDLRGLLTWRVTKNGFTYQAF